MKYLKVLLTIYLVDKVFMQWYERVVYPPFFNIYCKETLVSSVIHCLAVGRTSKNVRLIYNANNNYCRSQCTFLFNGTTRLGDEWHHYAIKSRRNAALLRATISSTVYENEHSLRGSQLATNGLIPWPNSSVNFFHSDFEKTPWLMVKLDGPRVLQFVRVFNRRGGNGERFHDVAFEVSMDGIRFEEKGFYKGPGLTDQLIEVLFDFPTKGQYVRIRITQGTNNLLHISEVEIYTLE